MTKPKASKEVIARRKQERAERRLEDKKISRRIAERKKAAAAEPVIAEAVWEEVEPPKRRIAAFTRTEKQALDARIRRERRQLKDKRAKNIRDGAYIPDDEQYDAEKELRNQSTLKDRVSDHKALFFEREVPPESLDLQQIIELMQIPTFDNLEMLYQREIVNRYELLKRSSSR